MKTAPERRATRASPATSRLRANSRLVRPCSKYRPTMTRQKLFEFGTRKDACRGSRAADATGPEGAADLEAPFRRRAVEQSGDVAGGEGVARTRAVDELDGKPAGPQRARFPGQNCALAAAGDDDRLRPRIEKVPGLFQRVGQARKLP